MAKTRKPQAVIEVTPTAPEADLPETEESTSFEEAAANAEAFNRLDMNIPIQGVPPEGKPHVDFTAISEREQSNTEFKPGVRQIYKLPTGAKRTDN